MKRDDEFCRRLCNDANRLLDAGFEPKQLWPMLKTLPYVTMWLHTPRLVEFENPPKGARWSDARKFQYKSKYCSEAHWFLPCGDDLYIKSTGGFVGTKKPYVIRSFRQYTANDIRKDMSRMGLNGTLWPDFENSIATFWYEQGLEQGVVIPEFGGVDAELRDAVWSRSNSNGHNI